MIIGAEKPSLDELAHFGVKGMKWGVIRDDMKRNHQLNKASRARDRVARDSEIDAARDRVSKVTTDDYKKIRAQYKVDKARIGSREARKKRYTKLSKLQEDTDTANMAKSGKETTTAVLIAVGGIAIKGLIAANVAANARR